MPDFEMLFAEKLSELEREARQSGMTMEALGAAAGVASGTLRRWKRRPPATIVAVAKLERVIAAKRSSIQA